jgi:hypothetical protein
MSVAKRLREVIAVEVNDRTRYLSLQESTGIKSDIWKNFWFGRREADTAMLQEISRLWPQYAYWLATGSTDAINGHTCPKSAFKIEPNCEQDKSNISDVPYLKAGVQVAKAIEFVEGHDLSEDDKADAYQTIANFIDGESVHKVVVSNWGLVDYAFKEIKQLTRIRKLRSHERESKQDK